MLDGRHVPNSPLPSAISCRGPHWRCGSPEFLTFPSRGHLENEPRLHHRVFFLKKPMQLSEPGLLPDFVLESDYGIGLRRRRLRRAHANVVIEYVGVWRLLREVFLLQFVLAPRLVNTPGADREHFSLMSSPYRQLSFLTSFLTDDLHHAAIMLQHVIATKNRVFHLVQQHDCFDFRVLRRDVLACGLPYPVGHRRMRCTSERENDTQGKASSSLLHNSPPSEWLPDRPPLSPCRKTLLLPGTCWAEMPCRP